MGKGRSNVGFCRWRRTNGVVVLYLVAMVSLWLNICNHGQSLVGKDEFGICWKRRFETSASKGTQDSRVDVLTSNVQLCKCEWYCEEMCNPNDVWLLIVPVGTCTFYLFFLLYWYQSTCKVLRIVSMADPYRGCVFQQMWCRKSRT